jgi:predicted AlkP superfamily phosphohydrolase/phosphomutase
MKTIILGIDGGTLSLFEALAEKGHLPNFSSLIKGGSRGKLKSIYPAITAPAWVSFMTGLLPDKHGIFDFLDHSQQSSIKKVVAASSIRSVPFWRLAGEQGKRVVIFNVPITYPPYPVNGVLVTGMLTPSLQCDFTYPRELGPKLRKELGDYDIDIPWRKYRLSDAPKFIDDITEATKARTKYLRYLMKNHDWDIAVAVFTEVDSLQHALWCFIDESDGADVLGPLRNQNIEKKMIGYYRYLDACMGEILGQIEGPYRLFIVSDHGFGPLKKRIHINRWLQRKGLLSYRRGPLFLEQMITSMRKVVRSVDIWDWRTSLRKTKDRYITKRYRDNVRDTIDWKKTKAFSAFRTEQGIYLNLEGRQPLGVLNQAEFESLREEIVGDLKKLRDPVSGEEIRMEVFKREDLYRGPFSHYAPDILVNAFDEGYFFDDLYHPAIFESPSWDSGTGIHRSEGIFLAYGTEIMEDTRLEGLSIIDVAPTVMYAMALPVPKHMEGKVRAEIFSENFRKTHPIQFMEYGQKVEECQGGAYSPDEEDKVKETLRGLGYLT